MYYMLPEDVVRDRYHELLSRAEQERRAARYLRLERARKRLEKATLRLHRVLAEAQREPALQDERPVPIQTSYDQDRKAA